MRSLASDALLRAVGRRLRLQSLAQALRGAAWTAAAALLVGVSVHLFVAPLRPAVVLIGFMAPWLVAAGWAVSRRVTPAECAAWADRHLAGASAYATLLESPFDDSSPPASPAVERLLQWVQSAVPRSRAMLEALPLRLHLAKPLLAAFVSAVLAAVLLQMPSRHAAANWDHPPGVPALQPKPAALETPPNSRVSAAEATDPTLASQQGGPTQPGEPAADTERASADGAGDGEGVAQEMTLTTALASSGPGSRAAPGGREAGDSPDTVGDTALSASWEGALAREMRSSPAVPPDGPARADASRIVDYAAATGQREQALADTAFAPSPAVAPEARPRTHLGPAEQAYIRAYFSGSGAPE